MAGKKAEGRPLRKAAPGQRSLAIQIGGAKGNGLQAPAAACRLLPKPEARGLKPSGHRESPAA